MRLLGSRATSEGRIFVAYFNISEIATRKHVIRPTVTPGRLFARASLLSPAVYIAQAANPLQDDHLFYILIQTSKMTSSFVAKAFGVALILARCSHAQLTGSLLFDNLETVQVTIQNDSNDNYTFPGTNNLFDRQNLFAYAPIQVTTLSGQPVTLNGTRYAAPQLSDDVFQDIPPGGTFTRNLNMSQYILGGREEGILVPATAPVTQSMCFIASIPSSYYGLLVTGIPYNTQLATYYLRYGLKSVTVQSSSIHFNLTVPSDFTPDQAAAIRDDANQRRIARLGTATIQTGQRRARRRQRGSEE